jgi:hypothetical protein
MVAEDNVRREPSAFPPSRNSVDQYVLVGGSGAGHANSQTTVHDFAVMAVQHRAMHWTLDRDRTGCFRRAE